MLGRSRQQDGYDNVPQSEPFLLEAAVDEAEKNQGTIGSHFRNRRCIRKSMNRPVLFFCCSCVVILLLVIAGFAQRRTQDTTSSKAKIQKSLESIHPHRRRIRSTIPTLIWQTWKTHPGDEGFADHLRGPVQSWSRLNPNHTQIDINDAQAMQLVSSLYSSIPQVVDAYRSMPLNVQRADFFRYLILFAMGGIYTDVDTTALKPFSQWLHETTTPEEQAGIIIGIEVDAEGIPNWADLWARKLQFCQWTIVSKPGHPILADIIARITQDTLDMKRRFGGSNLTPEAMTKSTLEYTGPGIWTDVIFDYLNDPRYFSEDDKRDSLPYRVGVGRGVLDSAGISGLRERKLLGDVVLLPITSFSPDEHRMGSEPIDHPMAFVKHHFQGSWKGEETVKGAGVPRRRR